MLEKLSEEISKVQQQMKHPKNYSPGDYDWLMGRLNGLRTAQHIVRSGGDKQFIDAMGRIRG